MTQNIHPSLESQNRLFSVLGKNITSIERLYDRNRGDYPGYLCDSSLIFTFEDGETVYFWAGDVDISDRDEAFVIEVDAPRSIEAYPDGPLLGRFPVTELEMFVGTGIIDLRALSANWVISYVGYETQKFLGNNPHGFVLVSSEEANTVDQSYHIKDGLMLRFSNGGVMLIQASSQTPLDLDVWYWTVSGQEATSNQNIP